MKSLILTLKRRAGFTLLEVLVATAVTGIALGVIMSTIAQGHRQAFRGDMEREAGIIAETIMQNAEKGEESGEVEGHPGWQYSIELREPELSIREASGENDSEEMEFDMEGFEEIVVTVISPDRGRELTVSRLVRKTNQ